MNFSSKKELFIAIVYIVINFAESLVFRLSNMHIANSMFLQFQPALFSGILLLHACLESLSYSNIFFVILRLLDNLCRTRPISIFFCLRGNISRTGRLIKKESRKTRCSRIVILSCDYSLNNFVVPVFISPVNHEKFESGVCIVK